MRAMLFARADGNEKARVARDRTTDGVGGENAQMQRQAHVVIAGCTASLAAAEWLRGNSGVWAWLAGAAAVVALVFAVLPPRRPPLTLAAALACLVLGVVLVSGAAQIWRIQCCWPSLRERRVRTASRALQSSLGRAIAEARRLAERGAKASLLPQQAAFDELNDAVMSGSTLERGATVLKGDPDPHPVAWAGRHRIMPAQDTTELEAVMTPFYAVLEARRQTQRGTSVGSVLLSAAPAVSDADHSFSAAFARDHGVSLRFFPAGAGPRDSSVFEICKPQTPASPCENADLFSVLTIPPTQGDAKLAAVARTDRLARVMLGLMLALLLVAAPGAWRWGVVMVGAWTLLRAPVGPAALFSPATFYRPVPIIGASAGALLVGGVLLLVAAGWLWRRGVERRWWGIVAAVLLMLAAPYVVRYFGRGIAPPATGVSLGLWLSWQAALAVTAMALILLAAALVRGAAEPQRVSWAIPAACAWGALAAIGGLWLWDPHGAWPEWYTFLWLPALAGVILPAPRRWALGGMAIVAGTAAALLAWGAAVEGRLSLASRDGLRMRREGDAVAVALLERLGQQVNALSTPPPTSAADLYAVWASSPLVAEDYPATMGPAVAWRRDQWAARGERVIDLPGGTRHVHLRVDLRGPWTLLVRGMLVVLWDAALLGGVWWFGLIVAESWRPRIPVFVATVQTSYRAQLITVLSAFFVLPVVVFAAWSFARLADEVRRSGDLLIRQTLRDAATGAETVVQDRPEAMAQSFADFGRGLDAELLLYRPGQLVASSSLVLARLGLVDPFLAPPAYRITRADELELTMDARTAGRPTRIGYRVVGSGPPGDQAVLAAPQLLDDQRVREQQEDLVLGLVLGTLIGLVAAVYLAGFAARRLAEPVAALRAAALAVGRGSDPPAFPPRTPREFEPVLTAFDRMVTDLRRSRAALEEARQRSARVLANVATGVIAVDDALRVTMANPRASELILGAPERLAPGDVLPQATPATWAPLWHAVAEFVAANRDVIAER